jgi:hypothetical protein
MVGNTVNYVDSMPDISEVHQLAATHIRRMKDIRLNQLERIQFAEMAMSFRYPNERPNISPASLLSTNEVNDLRGDLWSTMLDVHNALLRGGIQFPSGRVGRKTGLPLMSATRRVKNVALIAKFQKELWNFSVEYLEAMEEDRAA